jgi:hypothetical protein
VGSFTVVLGWALGLGTALLLDWKRNQQKVSAARTAMLAEFDEIAYRLIGVVFKLDLQHSRLDRKRLEWLGVASDRYKGLNRLEGLPDRFSEILATPEAELAQVNALFKAIGKSSFIPEEDAPYATASIAQAHDFEPAFAVSVMDVLSQIRMYNEVRENALRYTVMTFETGLDKANYDLILGNADAADEQLAKRARIIVDKIHELRTQYGPSSPGPA